MQGGQVETKGSGCEDRMRRSGQCGRPGARVGECAALGSLRARPGGDDGDGGPEREVRALLGCRAFLWDVLLDGEWTGCARHEVRRLCERYGADAVTRAFERE